MIKLMVLDVDGTLTDGKIYMSANGELMKAFNIKDGYALARLSSHGVTPVILTGRESEITLRRCEELKIQEVHQGVLDKASRLAELAAKFNCTLAEIAYLGDDINDLECLKLCGISACPADAAKAVREACSYVSPICGGQGAARDIIEWLIDQNQIPAEILQ
jgi:3-deoxy-D-manno-octulosonate 8-phosphate phosphatase (KDO 8-P phosphatase)